MNSTGVICIAIAKKKHFVKFWTIKVWGIGLMLKNTRILLQNMFAVNIAGSCIDLPVPNVHLLAHIEAATHLKWPKEVFFKSYLMFCSIDKFNFI